MFQSQKIWSCSTNAKQINPYYNKIQAFSNLNNLPMIKLTFIMILLASSVLSSTIKTGGDPPLITMSFSTYCTSFSMPTYSSSQSTYRALVYNSAVSMMNLFNQFQSSTYTMGLNKFTSLATDQFAAIVLQPAFNISNSTFDNGTDIYGLPGIMSIQIGDILSYDINTYSGSSLVPWLNSIEFNAVSKSPDFTVPLSTQQIIQCTDYNNPDLTALEQLESAVDYLTTYGLMSASAYPSSSSISSCQYAGGPYLLNTVAGDNGYGLISGCSAFQIAIAQNKSVIAMVDGTDLQYYSAGLFAIVNTGLVNTRVIFRFIQNSHTDYWMIKNSWGDEWGESGYMRILKPSDYEDPVNAACTYGAYLR